MPCYSWFFFLQVSISPTRCVHLPKAQENTTYKPHTKDTPSAWLLLHGFTLSNVRRCEWYNQCANPSYYNCAVFSNKTLLELYYTCLNHHNDQGGKYYVTLARWLRLIVGVDRSEKAVNAKARQVDVEYTKRLKMFQARKGKSQCDALNSFLDCEFIWNQDMRKGKVQKFIQPSTVIVAVTVTFKMKTLEHCRQGNRGIWTQCTTAWWKTTFWLYYCAAHRWQQWWTWFIYLVHHALVTRLPCLYVHT